MNAPSLLFRKEVIEHRAERLQGDVSLATPLSWQITSYFLFFSLIATAIFLASASYSRSVIVSGEIVIDKGAAQIVPSRLGIVTELAVREGMDVKLGQPLVTIRSQEYMIKGETGPDLVIDALRQQDSNLSLQVSLVRRAAEAERERIENQIAGLNEEIANLDEQIDDQRRLVLLSEDDYHETKQVALRGFISRRDLETRESTWLSRRQQLAQLLQTRSSKSGEVQGHIRAMAQTTANAEAQAANLQSSRGNLAQQVAEAEAMKGYVLNSPFSGTVTALTARVGQPTVQGQPLMVVMPSAGRPRVELYVPTSAAGFLAPGQEVRLAIDAFSYQQFGSVEARIDKISRTAIPRPQPNGGTMPVYLVTAQLAKPWIRAFGKRQPLVSGMTLTARIVTNKQTLIEWLFEPLFAVQRR